MPFQCKNCKEKVTNSKMVGLVFGQIAAATLESKGIKTQSALVTKFKSHDIGAGFLSAMRVECPNCRKTNWD